MNWSEVDRKRFDQLLTKADTDDLELCVAIMQDEVNNRKSVNAGFQLLTCAGCKMHEYRKYMQWCSMNGRTELLCRVCAEYFVALNKVPGSTNRGIGC